MTCSTTTSKASEAEGLDYWERLKAMKLYSLERRRERYHIIYIWKVLEGLVPNINYKINSTNHAQLGRKCTIHVVPRGRLHKIREASLPVNGAKLFNSLPKQIRDLTVIKLDSFKRALDNFLKTVPDHPQLPGYMKFRRAATNSLLHIIALSENLSVAYHL